MSNSFNVAVVLTHAIPLLGQLWTQLGDQFSNLLAFPPSNREGTCTFFCQ